MRGGAQGGARRAGVRLARRGRDHPKRPIAQAPGEPLLLLHGFTGAWMHWRPLLDDLSERYEVIAPTLAGHDGGGRIRRTAR